MSSSLLECAAPPPPKIVHRRRAETRRNIGIANHTDLAAGRLVLVSGGAAYWIARPTAPPTASLAVLPFVNAGGDPDADYLSDTEAYESYLKGRYYWNRRTEESLKRAVASFKHALKLDTGYALAAAGLADCYALYAVYQLEPPRESGPKAKAAAAGALQLDQTMAEPHGALGFVKSHYDWDWAGAEREFQRSIELDPTYANGQFWYAVHLSATGRTDLAVAALQRAPAARSALAGHSRRGRRGTRFVRGAQVR